MGAASALGSCHAPTLVTGNPRRHTDKRAAQNDELRHLEEWCQFEAAPTAPAPIGIIWKHLRSCQRKLVIKGVQCLQDAERIKSIGADAIWVSNHGGRQLNAAPSAIESLIAVRDAVGEDFPLIMDGGSDVASTWSKPLLCRADFVMLGRTVMYAIGADGERGLSRMLSITSVRETRTVMGLLSYRSIGDIGRHCLASSPSGLAR